MNLKLSDVFAFLSHEETEGIVVSISGDTDVMVEAGNLTEAQTAQIIDIVQRKTAISPENIIITVSGVE